ncbi:MAG: glycosyltransferase [Rhodospirillales bacterium]|nr:glycosyltransferase [Rhodospirillales bacterium]
MHITMIDESVPFDGSSPSVRPLGGPEKAFVGLAAALARRGHQVSAINMCEKAANIDGVQWLPFDTPRPPETDVLIAFRKPELLGEVLQAEKKVLWVTSHARTLNRPRAQEAMDKHRPTVVFQGRAHAETWSPWREFRQSVIPPGINAVFLDEPNEPVEQAKPPRAIVTTHPRLGLDGILDLWSERIRAHAHEARLHVYSSALFRARQGGEVPENLTAVFARVRGMEDQGVIIEKPGTDVEMADVYRRAAVHLYPTAETEVFCWTLAESQACGLPAVARTKGSAAEHVRNGQTGFLVPDDTAFANVTVHLLTNEGARNSMRRDALTLQKARSWDVVAADFETIWR